MEVRSAESVKEQLRSQHEELRHENFLLRQRAAPGHSAPVGTGAVGDDAGDLAGGAAGGEAAAAARGSTELELIDVGAELKSAQAQLQHLQREVVAKDGEVTHHRAMAESHEKAWREADAARASQRAAFEVRSHQCNSTCVARGARRMRRVRAGALRSRCTHLLASALRVTSCCTEANGKN
jgi:hypothetical protein